MKLWESGKLRFPWLWLGHGYWYWLVDTDHMSRARPGIPTYVHTHYTRDLDIRTNRGNSWVTTRELSVITSCLSSQWWSLHCLYAVRCFNPEEKSHKGTGQCRCLKNFSEKILLFPFYILLVIFPKVSRLFQKGYHLHQRHFERVQLVTQV